MCFSTYTFIQLHGPVRTLYHNVDGDILDRRDQNHYMEVVDKDNTTIITINFIQIHSGLEPGWIIPLDIGPATQVDKKLSFLSLC